MSNEPKTIDLTKVLAASLRERCDDTIDRLTKERDLWQKRAETLSVMCDSMAKPNEEAQVMVQRVPWVSTDGPPGIYVREWGEVPLDDEQFPDYDERYYRASRFDDLWQAVDFAAALSALPARTDPKPETP